MRAPGNERPQLINMYGITETTVHVTYRELERAGRHDRREPIGRTIPIYGSTFWTNTGSRCRSEWRENCMSAEREWREDI